MPGNVNTWWLLDLTVHGRVLRYSHDYLEITDDAGNVYPYRPGLGDLRLAKGGEDVEIELADPDIDWPALAAALEGGACVVRRWSDGATLEDATVYTSGVVAGVTHGTRHEPISWNVAKVRNDESLGREFPDTLARITEDTFPIASGTIGEEGAMYPLLFGTPGNLGDGTAIPVMPVPLAEWNFAGTGTAVVSVEVNASPGSNNVVVRNDQLDSEETESLSQSTDGLGRRIQTVSVSGTNRPTSATEKPKLYVGFSSGGGSARTLYEVVDLLLQRWGPESVDWARVKRLEAELSQYQVDSWVDQTVDNPWAWIEDVVSGALPYEIRTSERGRYIERIRFRPTGQRIRMSVETDRDADRIGGRARSGPGPFNEYTCLYRPGLDGDWLGRVVATGRSSIQSKPVTVRDPSPSSTELAKVIADGRCSKSLARFGLRVAEPIELDWTWDTGTALAVLDLAIEESAMPGWESAYWVKGGHDLEVGDEITVTDPDFGLVDEPMLVLEPVVADRTDWVQVSVRYDAE